MNPLYLMDDLPLIIRSGMSDDYGFILDTWVQHFHKTIPATYISNPIFIPSQTKLINSILEVSSVATVCLDDEINTISGYLVHQPYDEDKHIIHWGHFKGYQRRKGYMHALLTQLGLKDKTLICTHYFKLFPDLRDRYKLIYDPTLLEDFR